MRSQPMVNDIWLWMMGHEPRVIAKLPMRERLIQALLETHKPRGYRRDPEAIERLIKMGLMRRERTGFTTRWTHYVLTPAGEEAVWEGKLPIPDPLPKTARKEKRARHV